MNPKLIKAGEVSKDMPVGVESVRHHRLAACRGIQLLASVFKLYATSDSRRNCTTHTSSREGRFLHNTIWRRKMECIRAKGGGEGATTNRQSRRVCYLTSA
jgi:gamma-glutamyl-gamma-aminobutyrate hydrolase PuuD